MSGKFSKPSENRSGRNALTPSSAAYRLTHVLNAVCQAHGLDRFPVNVADLALEAAKVFGWDDPITEVRSAQIESFEGALIPNDERSSWLLLFNDDLRSDGRIRFTQAHELGHYILHRTLKDSCRCSDADMIDLEPDEQNLESQADSFASTLLMPLDDFRDQMSTAATFEALGVCAARYGVSLTAATLRWLSYTNESALLVVHRDGYMLWSVASQPARRAGAFFRTRRGPPIPIPSASLAACAGTSAETTGQETNAKIWFPYASANTTLKEMKICADHYDFVMTLLVLPRGERVWPPRQSSEFEDWRAKS